MTTERARRNVLGILAIVSATLAIYGASLFGRIIWEGRHYDCFGPTGECARGGK